MEGKDLDKAVHPSGPRKEWNRLPPVVTTGVSILESSANLEKQKDSIGATNINQIHKENRQGKPRQTISSEEYPRRQCKRS